LCGWNGFGRDVGANDIEGGAAAVDEGALTAEESARGGLKAKKRFKRLGNVLARPMCNSEAMVVRGVSMKCSSRRLQRCKRWMSRSIGETAAGRQTQSQSRIDSAKVQMK